MAKRGGYGLSNSTPDEALTFARGETLWSIERRGARVTRASGAATGRARVTLRRCASVPSARELVARSIAAKLNAGFRPAGRPAGWPARPGPLVASSAPHERALRGARDAAAFVAYGEWLRAQGDPRGAFVTASTSAGVDGVVPSGCHDCDVNAAWFRRSGPRGRRDRPPWWPSPASLLMRDAASPGVARHRELLERHGRHVVGRAAAGDEGPLFGFRLGFVEVIHFDHPGDGGDLAGARASLRRALRLPASRHARVVDVKVPAEDFEDGPLFTDESFVRDALAGRAFPSVVSFSIGALLEYYEPDPEFGPGLWEGWPRKAAPLLGGLAAASSAFPRLEHLSASGRGIDLGGVDLSRLRHAAFHLVWPEEESLDAIASADWPRLRSLRLVVGELKRPEHASDVAAKVVSLVEGRRAPGLRHLRLERVPLTDELCDVLGCSSLADTLVSLEIVDSEMTAQGAEALLRHRHRLRRLRALSVKNNTLSDDALAALAKGFGRRVELIAGPQSDAYEHDDASDSEFVREEELRARGGRPDPLGGPARDDDEGDDIEGLLDAAVVLTSLRGDGGDDEADEDDEDDDGLEGGPPAPEGDLARDDDEFGDTWPTGVFDDEALFEDDDAGGLSQAGRGARRGRRAATPD